MCIKFMGYSKISMSRAISSPKLVYQKKINAHSNKYSSFQITKGTTEKYPINQENIINLGAEVNKIEKIMKNISKPNIDSLKIPTKERSIWKDK